MGSGLVRPELMRWWWWCSCCSSRIYWNWKWLQIRIRYIIEYTEIHAFILFPSRIKLGKEIQVSAPSRINVRLYVGFLWETVDPGNLEHCVGRFVLRSEAGRWVLLVTFTVAESAKQVAIFFLEIILFLPSLPFVHKYSLLLKWEDSKFADSSSHGYKHTKPLFS